MTSYSAYNANLPCQNPSCKSEGKPHPNCRCYGDVSSSSSAHLAEGGEVESYCSSERAHKKECEYYKDGGEVHIPQHEDHTYSVASYLGSRGAHGLLKFGSGEHDLEKHNKVVHHGHRKLNAHIDHLFKGGDVDDEDHEKSKKSIHEWIEKGGIEDDLKKELYTQNTPQRFADGGKVNKEDHGLHNHHVSNAYPEQNIMLQTAKGRVSNYLSSIKPQKNSPKLAFDAEPDQRQQTKSYNSALGIAAHPLSILKKIKKGTIEPDDVTHLKNLYPELDGVITKRLTEKITEAQLKNEKPNYKIRQGMSLYLGVPLSGEMSPQNIMAAQATFKGKQAPQQQDGQGAPKKSTSSLSKMDDSMMTSTQARVGREQKQ